MQQMICLIFQSIWYVSPIFFEPKLFQSAKDAYLIDWNPIYHILNLFRAPMLEGKMPTLDNYIFSIATVIILLLFQHLLYRVSSKTLTPHRQTEQLASRGVFV